MINFLVNRFVKNPKDTQNPAVRAQYGTLSGGIGIVLNLCLFVAKMTAVVLTSSIAIAADAFNNLSDAGSSVVTLVGFRMAGRPSDNEHPFGHGRIEYLAGLAVSVAIFVVGLELGKSSFLKIFAPEPVSFSAVSVVILIVAILVKLWMCYLNLTLGRRLASTAMRATAMDSLTDTVATFTVLVGVLINLWFKVNLDGWFGVLVAAFILYTGFQTARSSLSPLLGEAPDKRLVMAIEAVVLAHENVMGLHDLIIHDYGPGRRLISLHVEMPSTMDLLAMHDEVDIIELELRRRFQCDATIHMDPIEAENEEVMRIRARVTALVKEVDSELTIHDFRMVTGTTHTNLIFDVVMPHKFHLSRAQTAEQVHARVDAMEGAQYYAVIRVEEGFL